MGLCLIVVLVLVYKLGVCVFGFMRVAVLIWWFGVGMLVVVWFGWLVRRDCLFGGLQVRLVFDLVLFWFWFCGWGAMV